MGRMKELAELLEGTEIDAPLIIYRQRVMLNGNRVTDLQMVAVAPLHLKDAVDLACSKKNAENFREAETGGIDSYWYFCFDTVTTLKVALTAESIKL